MAYYFMIMGISWLVCGVFNWLCAFISTLVNIPSTSDLLGEHPVKTLACELAVYTLIGIPLAMLLGPIPWLAGSIK
jgi:hypothetical protein